MRGFAARWGVVGALALAVMTTLAPAVGAAADFSAVAGTWSGYITYPSGSSEISEWTIDNSGRYSFETGAYAAEGNLQQVGNKYAFAFERNGQDYSGTLTLQNGHGQRRLVGDGRYPDGPVNFLLTAGGK
jgi:hypothetical protein